MIQFPKSKTNEVVFYVVCALFLSLTGLLLVNPFFYNAFIYEENGFVEMTGAFSLLFTSGALFKAGVSAKTSITSPRFHAILFFVMALVFFWAFGEEISWGQHLFGTQTPQWLAAINGQKETNLHNINKKFFDTMQDRMTALLVIITAVLHFRGKEKFFGFRVPDVTLNLAFIMMLIYRGYDVFRSDLWAVAVSMVIGYMILAVLKKDYKVMLMIGSFITTFGVVYFVHKNYVYLFGGQTNNYHEVRETLFSLLCFVYALQLWKDVIPKRSVVNELNLDLSVGLIEKQSA